MNSKKKIIDTLKSADKASVEKLMAEEARKTEIFAKARERAASGSEGGFTEVESGVERYNRNIRMSGIASAAAAAVLLFGGITGGAFLMKKNGFFSGGSDVSSELTKKEIRDRYVLKGEYRKVSFDYEIIQDPSGNPSTIRGLCRLDKDTDTGYRTFELEFNNGTNSVTNAYCFDNYYIEACDEWGEDAQHEKTYEVIRQEQAEWAMQSIAFPMEYNIQDMMQALIKYDNWEVTDDSSVNGRRTLTIEGIYQKGSEGNEISYDFSIVMDAQTGIPLSESLSADGTDVLSLKLTDLRFDDDAEAPITQAEYKKLVIDGGYTKSKDSEYDLDILEGDIPVTTAMSAVEPVTVTVTAEAHNDVPEELTGEWLRERCLNATHYYDKFSADYHSFHATYGQNLGDWEENGTVKIDNTAMNGEMYNERSETDNEPYDRTYRIFLNNIYVYTDQNDIAAQNNNNEGKYCCITSTDTEYGKSEYAEAPDRVFFDDFGAFYYITLNKRRTYTVEGDSTVNVTEWTITDDRYENGRRTVSVSFSYDLLKEGTYITYYVNADIDAETGLWTNFEIHSGKEIYGENKLLSRFTLTNIRFDDEAEAPMTAAEVRDYLDSNGYKADENTSEYKVENIG